MGYYCTVPQCTSLAGKTKNVKFHRFPRDLAMADKWNLILKRGKPYTKYSKVCSLHFTQADYNVTTMGQWKTLSKDAVPSQNLPKLNPDGSVMVIRKSRTIRSKDFKKEDCEKIDNKSWQSSVGGHIAHPLLHNGQDTCMSQDVHDNSILAYRLQTIGNLASNLAPQHTIPQHGKPRKQDAFMQTEPVLNDDDDTQPNNSYSEVSDKSYSSEMDQYNQSYPKEYPKESSPYSTDTQYPKDGTPYPKEGTPYPKEGTPYPKEGTPYPREATPYKDTSYPRDDYKDTSYPKDTTYHKDTSYPKDTTYPKSVESYPKETTTYEPKDYRKATEDYIPQTNEEYNKEAEKYALATRKVHGYEPKDYQKIMENSYQKLPVPDMYSYEKYNRDAYYQNGYADSAEVLRSQQHNLQMLQEQQHRVTENQNFFNENHIKQEIDISGDDDKFMYERSKEQIESAQYSTERRQHQRFIDHLQQQVKQEPDTPAGGDAAIQSPSSPYYVGCTAAGGYYDSLQRPGAELLIAKQNALAAHTQLWPNAMKRPFYYSESPHFNGPQLLHRFDDIPRILQ